MYKTENNELGRGSMSMNGRYIVQLAITATTMEIDLHLLRAP